MMKSPTNHLYEGGNSDFDHLVDFSQFLEEAKKHKAQELDKSPRCDRQTQNKQSAEDKKKRHSWKKSFLSLFKLAEKKNDLKTDPTASSYPSRASRGGRASASGPLYESGSGPSFKARGPRSGPLASLFVPNKRVGNESPYICLEKDDKHSVVQCYGPVYLVT